MTLTLLKSTASYFVQTDMLELAHTRLWELIFKCSRISQASWHHGHHGNSHTIEMLPIRISDFSLLESWLLNIYQCAIDECPLVWICLMFLHDSTRLCIFARFTEVIFVFPHCIPSGDPWFQFIPLLVMLINLDGLIQVVSVRLLHSQKLTKSTLLPPPKSLDP